MGQIGKQILGAHQAGGRRRWKVLRPWGAHLQLRPAGAGSRHSCPRRCSLQSPPHGHQHPGAAARGTGETGSWEKSNSEGQNSQGWVLERRTSEFRVRRAGTQRESTTSFLNLLDSRGCAIGISQLQRALQSQKSILAPCCAQEAGLFPQGTARLVIPGGACVGSCRDLSHRNCFH